MNLGHYTVVVACLVKLGYSAEDAIAAVQQVRSGALSVAAQRDFIHRFDAAQTQKPQRLKPLRFLSTI